jgi:uncharacterized protein
MTQGAQLPCPVPLQIVSNEEYPPLPSTARQRQVQHLILDAAERLSRSQRISRRDFLKTSGGMALCFLTMNQVFGRFFDVLDVEAAEPGAAS